MGGISISQALLADELDIMLSLEFLIANCELETNPTHLAFPASAEFDFPKETLQQVQNVLRVRVKKVVLHGMLLIW